MSAEIILKGGNTLVLTGEVASKNVVAIRDKGDHLISKIGSEGVIDLSGLLSANTITLSLLLSWLRSARRHNVSLKISQVPRKIFDMARVSGLELILPFDTVDSVL